MRLYYVVAFLFAPTFTALRHLRPHKQSLLTDNSGLPSLVEVKSSPPYREQSASNPPRYSAMIADPIAKLLDDEEDLVPAAGKFIKKNKFSTALVKDLAKVSEIEKAPTADILKAGLSFVPGSGYALNALSGSPSFAIGAIAQSAAKAIFEAKHMRGLAALNAPRFKPLPVTLSGPQLLGQLLTVLADPNWAVCSQNAASDQCVLLRKRTEEYMDQILSVNFKSLPAVFGYMAQFFHQLVISKQQLIAIWLALQGDKSVKFSERRGLQRTIPLLLKSIDEQSTQLERAFDIVNKDIQSRYDIFGPELARLTKEQETASQSIIDLGTQMTGTNQLKLAVQIHKFQNALGDSLTGISNDAKDILEDTDDGMSELQDAFDLYVGENDPKLDMLKKGVQTLRSDANTQVKGIKESFKAAETALMYAAKSQDKDFRKDADRAMFDIPRAFNLTLSKGMKEVDQNATRRFAPIAAQLNEQLTNVNRTLSKLLTLIQAHDLGAISDLNSTKNGLLSLMSDVLKEVDIKSIFNSKEIRNTAKLQADEMARVRELGSYSNSRSEKLRKSANQKTQSARTKSSRLYSQLVDTVASGMNNMTLDVDAVVTKARLSAAGVEDQVKSGLADIKSKFFTSSTSTVETMTDASETLATQKELTNARIKALADISKISTSQQSANLNSAIADAGITSGSLLSESNQQARDLSASSLLAIANDRNGIVKKSDALVASLDGIFGNFQSDILENSRGAKASVSDALDSIDSVTDMQRIVGNRVGDLSDQLVDYTKSNQADFDTLTHALTNSENLIESTGQKAGLELNSTISSGLNSFLSSIQSTLSSASSKNFDVVSQLMNTINENYADATTYIARITMENLKLQNELSDLLSELTNSTAEENIEPLLRTIVNNETIKHMIGLRKPFDSFQNTSANYEAAESANIQKAESRTIENAKKLANDAYRDLDTFNATLLSVLVDLKSVENRLGRDKQTIELSMSPSSTKGQLESRFNDLVGRIVDISDSVKTAAKESFSKIIFESTNASDEVLQKSNETRTNVSDRFNRVESLISENLGMLNGGMNRMTTSFSEAAKSQDRIMRLQDEKFIGVAKDIANALFAKEMEDESAPLRDKASSTVGIVVGLMRALKDHDEGNKLYYEELRKKIADMKSSVDTKLGITANGMNKTIDTLATARLRDEIARSQFVNNLVSQFGPLLDSNGVNLEASRNRLLGLTQSSAVASAQANADTYTMEGRWKRMSDQAKAKLSELIDSVRKGNLSVGQALAQARESGLAQMQSAQQAVEVMNQGMLKYLEGLHSAFDGSQERLSETERVIKESLDKSGGKLIVELDNVRNKSSVISDSVKTFSGKGNFEEYMDKVSQLQNQVQGNQTAVNGMLEKIQKAVDEYESDLTKRETDYETYVQETIDNVTNNVTNRQNQLRKRIFNVTDVSTSP